MKEKETLQNISIDGTLYNFTEIASSERKKLSYPMFHTHCSSYSDLCNPDFNEYIYVSI